MAGRMPMKKIVSLLVLLVAAYAGWDGFDRPNEAGSSASQSDRTLAGTIGAYKSGEQIQGSGVVTNILSDDNEGNRHQRFVLRLPSGETLLIAHNIDLAPRLSSLNAGDLVAFNGVYEWNSKGGVVHWTHRDPNGRHEAGWLKHNGRTYQ